MIDEPVGTGRDSLDAGDDLHLRLVRKRQARAADPGGIALENDGLSGQEARHDALGILRIGEPPALGRRIERNAQRRVALRRHRGMAVQRIRHLAGERVGAAMAAEQRHDARPVLGDGENRRLGALVLDHGGQRADQDAGGADADDGRAGLIERANMVQRLGEGHVEAGHPVGEPVQRGTRQSGRDAARDRLRRRRQDEDCGGSIHASSPL